MKQEERLVTSSLVESETDSEKVVQEGKLKETEGIISIPFNQLHEFKGHPFKVENDMELFELMRSIEKEGVIVPAIVRPNPYGSGYEVIAGHRRMEAGKWVGLMELPVVIRDLDDNQAVCAMVDSNLQREHIKPSEKAFAFKMKLDAMNCQGKRSKTTFGQFDQKSESLNTGVVIHSLKLDKNEVGYLEVRNALPDRESSQLINSRQELARQVGESERQIQRYIRLTYLIPKIMKMVDEEKIALTPAVEISYLTEEEQHELSEVMEWEQSTPSLSQANRMKRMSQSGKLDMDMLYEILGEEKANQREQIRIRADLLADYFPTGYTPKQKVELIENLVKEWHSSQSQKQIRSNDRKGVYCIIELPKVAKQKWTLLHVQNGHNCKA